LPRGGRRPGAGRPRGSRSRRTFAEIKLLPARVHQREVEDLPLAILMKAARDPEQPIEIRLAAARAAAPYYHARPSSGPPKASYEMSLSELEDAIEREREHALRLVPGQRQFHVVGEK
jgi:hypothetical protein